MSNSKAEKIIESDSESGWEEWGEGEEEKEKDEDTEVEMEEDTNIEMEKNQKRARELKKNPKKLINIYVEIRAIDFGFRMKKYKHYNEMTRILSSETEKEYFLLTSFFLEDIIYLDGSIDTSLIKIFVGTKHFKVYDDEDGNFRVDLDVDENGKKVEKYRAYLWLYISRSDDGGWVRVNAGCSSLAPDSVTGRAPRGDAGKSSGIANYTAVSRSVLKRYNMPVSEDRRMIYEFHGKDINTPSASVSFEIFGLETGLTHTLLIYERHHPGGLGRLTMEQLRLAHTWKPNGPIWVTKSHVIPKVKLTYSH